MIKNLIVVVFSLFAFYSLAQNKEELKVKFGKISEQEIAMKVYDKDLDAPAVILFDKGYIEPVQQRSITAYNLATHTGSAGRMPGMGTSAGGKVTAQKNGRYERHIRLKIFKKEAYNKADFEILYSKKLEQAITDLKAVCYNLENGVLVETKATKDNIHDEVLNKRLNVQKITVPGVKEGSIIELKYTISNPSLQDWYFQHDIPTVWSEYEMNVPDNFLMSQIGQGFTPYAINTKESKAGETAYHWLQKNVPAIKPEKFMTSVEDYRTKMTFYVDEINYGGGMTRTVTQTWEKEAKELMEDEDFGGFIYKKNALKDELATVVTEIMTPIEKVQAIYNYIGKNFEASKYSSLYITESIKDLKASKKVTPTEMNFFFLNMLNSSGIKVAPVLIRTRDKGSVATDRAVLERYNRVISQIRIEKDTFYVDASGYPQPLKLLPINALSNYGIAFLGKEQCEAVIPQSKLTTRRFPQALLTLNTEGVLSGDVNMTFYGYDALDSRKAFKENGADKFAQTLLKDLIVDGKLESSKFENTDISSDLPLKGLFKVKTSSFVNKVDDKMYLSPFLSFGEKENPFKSDERKFDVDYTTPHDEFYQLTLTLPEGYKIEEMPKPTRIQLPDGTMKFEYLIAVKDNVISINTKFNIKRSTFFTDEYSNLKQLYAQILAKMGEQIVLTKTAK